MATLAQLAQQYLNQGLPNISGIFSLPQASSITAPVVEEEQVTTPQGLTAEQLALLYPQRTGGGDGPKGGGRFGNLDMSSAKDFYVGDEVVTGYKNSESDNIPEGIPTPLLDIACLYAYGLY